MKQTLRSIYTTRNSCFFLRFYKGNDENIQFEDVEHIKSRMSTCFKDFIRSFTQSFSNSKITFFISIPSLQYIALSFKIYLMHLQHHISKAFHVRFQQSPYFSDAFVIPFSISRRMLDFSIKVLVSSFLLIFPLTVSLLVYTTHNDFVANFAHLYNDSNFVIPYFDKLEIVDVRFWQLSNH